MESFAGTRARLVENILSTLQWAREKVGHISQSCRSENRNPLGYFPLQQANLGRSELWSSFLPPASCHQPMNASDLKGNPSLEP